MKKIAIIAVLILVVTVPVGLYFTGNLPFGASAAADESATLTEAPLVPRYLTLDPPFVVNFTHRGTLRYLQVSLDLMFYKDGFADKLTQQMPAVRNDLILLFSSQEFETLSTLAGKEQLRNDVRLTVNNAVGIDSTNPDDPAVEAVYITNFVMQ